MLSTAWEQPEGYRIEDRSWYQEMKQNGTELTITTPYLDMKTNRQVVSVGRMFRDGSNLIGVDVDLEDLSNLLKELDAGAGEIYIVDQTGSIIAGENPAFMGKHWTAYITERVHMRIMFQILIRNLLRRRKVLSAIRQTVHGYL